MKYLESFTIPDERKEAKFLLSFPYKLEMACYSHQNVYPFKIFAQRGFSHMEFEPVTIFYGGNGSGKSTLLNIIAQKLMLERAAPFNNTPFMEEYLRFCRFTLSRGELPKKSRVITSDDVFDHLLKIRRMNEGIEHRREFLFDEYEKLNDKEAPTFLMRTMDDHEELIRRNEARRKTKSVYVTKRLGGVEHAARSNGESAFCYFTEHITDGALYLLDEPENSLSPKLQMALLTFLEDSVRFFDCQIIMSTHSPFLLSARGAKIYDLDSEPVAEKKWTELENVMIYRDFFEKHRGEFE